MKIKHKKYKDIKEKEEKKNKYHPHKGMAIRLTTDSPKELKTRRKMSGYTQMDETWLKNKQNKQ